METVKENTSPNYPTTRDVGSPSLSEAVLATPRDKRAEIPAKDASTRDHKDPPESDELVTRVLRFLATAQPSTLGAVAVGLVASTYVVLGRIGLLLIGAFSGVVLYIYYEARHPALAQAFQVESGYAVLERLQLSQKERKGEGEGSPDHALSSPFPTSTPTLSLDTLSPEVASALREFTDAAVRDYVRYWYSPLIPSDSSFPTTCQNALTSFIVSMSSHLSHKRPADALIEFLTNSSSVSIIFFSELSRAYAEIEPTEALTAPDVIYSYLASNPNSALATLLDRKNHAAQFRRLADEMLRFLDKSMANCDVIRVFGREVIANLVLETVLQTCSKPEWINSCIVSLLEAGEPDLNQVIDAGMKVEVSVDSTPAISVETARLNAASPDQSIALKEEEATAKHSPSDGTSESDGEMIGSEASYVHLPTTEDATTPISATESAPASSSQPTTPSLHPPTHGPFTSFDQFVPEAPSPQSASVNPVSSPVPKEPLSLYNASITILDEGGNTTKFRSKPTSDYLIQIEPASRDHAGWMIIRQYSDFEALHEVISRIAQVSGSSSFRDKYNVLPDWRIHSAASLRNALEGYLRDSCAHQSLAESEAAKRFFAKQTDLRAETPSSERQSFAWDAMGKNMLGALATAPKGALQGGKAMVGGVTGVFGSMGIGNSNKRQSTPVPSSTSSSPSANRYSFGVGNSRQHANSSNSITFTPTKPVTTAMGAAAHSPRPSTDGRASVTLSRSSTEDPSIRHDSLHQSLARSTSSLSSPAGRKESSVAQDEELAALNLPPPPDEMPDNYVSSLAKSIEARPPAPSSNPREMVVQQETKTPSSNPSSPGSSHLERGNTAEPVPSTSLLMKGPSSPQTTTTTTTSTTTSSTTEQLKDKPPVRKHEPLTEQEAHLAVELIFAIINELYTLSSAWTFRRTLLTAAKNLLLRPGNPAFSSIQELLQTSVLDTYTSKDGVADRIRALRVSTLPTDEERASAPPSTANLSVAEREALCAKARKLFLQSAMPAALTSVMGQAATSEALGRVFDCLQMEEVARGFFFGILRQGMRILTQ